MSEVMSIVLPEIKLELAVPVSVTVREEETQAVPVAAPYRVKTNPVRVLTSVTALKQQAPAPAVQAVASA